MATGILPRGDALATTPPVDPRLAKLFSEIALLAAGAAEVIRETWQELPQLAPLQTVSVIGYLADQGAALTAGQQQRGDANAWLAPFLANTGSVVSLSAGSAQ